MTTRRVPVARPRLARGGDGARAFRRGAGGFTLIELLVCLAILGFLASLALPMAEMTAQREKERELKRALWEIRDALDAYRVARESGAVLGPSDRPPYPATLKELTLEVADARADRQGQTIRFLRRVPRDPFGEPGVPAEQTWGLRGYQSDADNPQPGAEVYDVHSNSPAKGLNGVPLKQW
ncbi:type II secretion system protein [Mitsuaria sp. GD03876]|uniref:type II secretion system protein n=1 Tax=Mitsuaria sp. GD03876 TaxID=2975399 RepID=UPI00244B4E84|nr:type II secretion system protein [Mitsuaria sp. GD03876]MDH0867066.1 type II secretion system GspH family protein [Mitsuaria sp. GD03876]